MKLRHFAQGAAFAAVLATAGAASAADLIVQATAGPWDPTISDPYGVGDQTAPTTLAVDPGDSLTISYVSGLTSAFGGVPPTVDANGYVGLIFGSGASCGGPPCTGIGSSGTYLPSYYIDPTNSGPQIALNALIGDFVNSSGAVISAFAPGDGPFDITAPAGAVAVQFGVNDDIFTYDNGKLTVLDNTGSLDISVLGSTAAVPEPATWAMMLVGLFSLGAAARVSRRKLAKLAVAG